MPFHVTADERAYLRGLAQKQAEYAALPVMERRRQQWYDLNDGRPGARPPVIIETWTFDRDFMPANVYRTTSPDARGIEHQLLVNIRNHELLDDDKVIPATFDIGWFVDIDEFGFKVESRHVTDANGYDVGYEFIHPIKDLDRDFAMLKPATCRVDRERTLEWKAFLEDLLGDILRVQITTGTYGHSMLTQRLIVLMGMEAFFLGMYDQPDIIHRYMAYLRDNALHVMRWAEAEGLLRVNNEHQQSFGSSYNWTHQLNATGTARLADMWGAANSQESIGIAPAQFHEFCAPYYRDVCEPFGRLYFGCCEPAHPYWDDIRQMPHLKKISVNRWTDQRFIGDALRGTDIVFSRKPDPNLLGVNPALDEDAWTAHIRETLEATRGVFTEIIIRDVYTVHGNLGKARRAVELARREVDRVV